jgi:hypothetical protein
VKIGDIIIPTEENTLNVYATVYKTYEHDNTHVVLKWSDGFEDSVWRIGSINTKAWKVATKLECYLRGINVS